MKVIVTLRAEKAPKDDEEKAFLAEIQANGKLEEWRREAEETLRARMRSELDDPDVLDVSVTIVEDTASCRMCEGTGRTARYGRKEEGEPPIVRKPCPRCTKGAVGLDLRERAAYVALRTGGIEVREGQVRMDSPFTSNCPDCSRPLPANIGDCVTGACTKRPKNEALDCLVCDNDPEYVERCTACGGTGKRKPWTHEHDDGDPYCNCPGCR